MSDLFFDESVILLNIKEESNEEVLSVMADNLIDKGLVKESFKQAVIAREKEFSTGLPTKGVSVAIPHTDVEHVIQKNISVAVLKEPVEFGIMGDNDTTTPVKIVFMLAMDEAHTQLNLLQRLMQIFQDEETLQTLANETNEGNIKNLLMDKFEYSLEGGE